MAGAFPDPRAVVDGFAKYAEALVRFHERKAGRTLAKEADV